MFCDLHTHSNFSDGSFSPARLIAQAKERDLIIALTDHNTTKGLPEFLEAARQQQLTAVAGIELSTLCRGIELHLVGLFLKPEHFPLLEARMEEYRQRKDLSNRQTLERLAKAGYPMDYRQILDRNPGGNINRAHIAAEMLWLGYVSSVQEAFDSLLDEGHGYYVPCPRMSTAEGIRLLRSLDALPVLAHPLKDLTELQLRDRLPELKAAGLVAMEVWHASYDDSAIALAGQIAEEFGLLPGGGSDFHGHVKPHIQLGMGLGNLRIPQTVYENLAAYHRSLTESTQERRQ